MTVCARGFCTSDEMYHRDWSGTTVSVHDETGIRRSTSIRFIRSIVTSIRRAEAVVRRQPAKDGGASESGYSAIITPPLDAIRTDGYSDGTNVFQGVRAYDPNMNQWATPDAYAGDVHDPMSQKPYMWNGNNPIAYSDPSGYDTGCATSVACTMSFVNPQPSHKDFYLQGEASTSLGGPISPVSVSAALGVTTAPGVYLTVTVLVGASAGASVGGGAGIISPNSHGTTAGVVSDNSTGAALQLGPVSYVHGRNNAGRADGVNYSTPTQVQSGVTASYGFYWGAKGASGASKLNSSGASTNAAQPGGPPQ